MSTQTQITAREWRIADPPDGYDGLRLHEAPVGKLGATDVLVKIHAVSLQYRDMMVSKGQYPLPVKASAVLGSDAAGSVVRVGSELDKITKHGALGAGVDGVLSTYKVLPSEIPEYLSFAEASTLPCAAVTAYNALLGGPNPLKGGDTVLVEGTGGVSIFALQFALASGAVPIVLTSSAEKIAAVKQLGAEHVINYKEMPEWQEEVLKLTDGEGVHHVIDMAGGKTLDKALRCTHYGGTISAIGFVDGGTTSPDSVVLQCVIKGVNIRGIQIGSRTQFEDMNRLLEARQIRPVVDKTFAFEKLVDALQYLESQKHVGKVVVNVA